LNLGEARAMPRSIGIATLVALLAAAASASPAAAQSRCKAPEKAGSWHSCLSASHQIAEDPDQVHLSTARARLAVRYREGCPEGADRRTVVFRTGAGDRLGRMTLRSKCRRGVARWDARVEIEEDLPKGTVVRSFWSGIADNQSAPRVKLTG
jgi:hypothetical protein